MGEREGGAGDVLTEEAVVDVLLVGLAAWCWCAPRGRADVPKPCSCEEYEQGGKGVSNGMEGGGVVACREENMSG